MAPRIGDFSSSDIKKRSKCNDLNDYYFLPVTLCRSYVILPTTLPTTLISFVLTEHFAATVIFITTSILREEQRKRMQPSNVVINWITLSPSSPMILLMMVMIAVTLLR
uniref:Uncharacterized protein n=1 Tax=Glossina austeni TaxID=7395 RepID=A0A1A9UEG8_GLOAU